jgi:hypothetical protein
MAETVRRRHSPDEPWKLEAYTRQVDETIACRRENDKLKTKVQQYEKEYKSLKDSYDDQVTANERLLKKDDQKQMQMQMQQKFTRILHDLEQYKKALITEETKLRECERKNNDSVVTRPEQKKLRECLNKNSELQTSLDAYIRDIELQESKLNKLNSINEKVYKAHKAAVKRVKNHKDEGEAREQEQQRLIEAIKAREQRGLYTIAKSRAKHAYSNVKRKIKAKWNGKKPDEDQITE